jgi:hypothetical protein
MMIAARNAFLMGGAKLPYDAEVEYLESTGTQYIDTGVVPNGAMDIDITYSVTAFTPSNNIALYGCVASGRGFFGGLARYGTDNANVYFVNYVDSPVQGLSFEFSTQYRDWTDGTTYHHNNQAVTVMAQTATSLSMSVCARRSASGVIERIGTMRVYACLIYSSGVLVRDFIPVRVGNGSSAVGYLYDRANPTGGPLGNGLYPNAGTGAFVIGPDK